MDGDKYRVLGRLYYHDGHNRDSLATAWGFQRWASNEKRTGGTLARSLFGPVRPVPLPPSPPGSSPAEAIDARNDGDGRIGNVSVYESRLLLKPVRNELL